MVRPFGGEVERSDEAAFGTEAIAALARFRADLAFVGAGGISMAGDITDFAPIPTELRIRMLDSAERGYVVADRTKFGRLTPIRLALLSTAALAVSAPALLAAPAVALVATGPWRCSTPTPPAT